MLRFLVGVSVVFLWVSLCVCLCVCLCCVCVARVRVCVCVRTRSVNRVNCIGHYPSSSFLGRSERPQADLDARCQRVRPNHCLGLVLQPCNGYTNGTKRMYAVVLLLWSKCYFANVNHNERLKEFKFGRREKSFFLPHVERVYPYNSTSHTHNQQKEKKKRGGKKTQ